MSWFWVSWNSCSLEIVCLSELACLLKGIIASKSMLDQVGKKFRKLVKQLTIQIVSLE